MKKTLTMGLASGTLLSLSLGAAGCTCTMQGQAGANAQGNGNGSGAAAPVATPAPAPAPMPHPAATTPPAPPPPNALNVPGKRLRDPRGNDVPVIHGGNGLGDDQQHPDSFKGFVYFIPEQTQKLPDLGALKPVAALFTRQFNITPRRFDAGFPGIDNRFEWFAIRYDGSVTLAKDGDYKFRVISDDGMILWIDGNKVMDNDGVHPPQEKIAVASLKAGVHTARVDYFQGPRYDIALQLWVTPPGGPEALFSPSF